jgi:hypothetical protein
VTLSWLLARLFDSVPVRRRGFPSAATLAWSEPLTALLRSAQSRVSSSRSLCKAAYGNPLRLPSGSNAEPVIVVAPLGVLSGFVVRFDRAVATVTVRRSHRHYARERAERSSACRCPRGTEHSSRRTRRAHAARSAGAVTSLCREVRVSSEGHPQKEPAVWARQRAPTAGVRGHCPAEDTLADPVQRF